MSDSTIDFDKFRLRRFVEKLIEFGEVVTHEEPVSLADLSAACGYFDQAHMAREWHQFAGEAASVCNGERLQRPRAPPAREQGASLCRRRSRRALPG